MESALFSVDPPAKSVKSASALASTLDGEDVPDAIAAFDALVDSTIKALHHQTLMLRAQLAPLLASSRQSHASDPNATTVIEDEWRLNAEAKLKSLIEAHRTLDAMNKKCRGKQNTGLLGHKQENARQHWYTEYDFKEAPCETRRVELAIGGMKREEARSK